MPRLKKIRGPIPKFKTEAEERKFWETHDTDGYVDWSKAQRVSFPNLKPSTKTISLRLPQSLLDRIRMEANKRDVAYQSLMKVWLAEKVDALHAAQDRKRSRAAK
jgi:predicted DNA binding CopG/RHH family protein